MNHDIVEVMRRPLEASRSKLVNQVTVVESEVELMLRLVMSKARRGSQGTALIIDGSGDYETHDLGLTSGGQYGFSELNSGIDVNEAVTVPGC
jgi:hypothetical protein